MVLSTLKDGQPRGRVVLLKQIKKGFTFFTNYGAKAQEITPYGSPIFGIR